MHSHQLWQKVESLETECQVFRAKCEATLANSMKLGNRNQYLREELMVLMEESVVEKCRALKVLEIARSGTRSEQASFAEFANVNAETTIILETLEEIKNDVSSTDSEAIHSLHTHLLSLPFLPESRRSRVVGFSS